jgi:hypothetical protein
VTRDEHLKSPSFRNRIKEADDYAIPHGLDKWSVRILWVCLSEGVGVGRRFAMRRSNYISSAAWDRYTRLVNNLWVSEDPPRFIYDSRKTPEWEADPMAWFNHISMNITPKSSL